MAKWFKLSKYFSSNVNGLKESIVYGIDNQSYYGQATGKLIKKERLTLVPHATLSIEAKNMQK